MAGGRRPANFRASSSRHTSASLDPAPGYYSLWQQPRLVSSSPQGGLRTQASPALPPYMHLMSTSTPPRTETPVPSTAAASAAASVAEAVVPSVASALATALETAVATAVTRALATVPGIGSVSECGADAGRTQTNPLAESTAAFPLGTAVDKHCIDDADARGEEHARSVASSSFSHVVGSTGCFDSEDRAGPDFGSLQTQLEAESAQRTKDLDELQTKVARFEAALASMEQSAAQASQRNSALEARVAAAEEAARRSVATATASQDALKASQKTIADLVLQKRKAESDADRYRSRLSALETQMDALQRTMETLPAKLDALEDGMAQAKKAHEDEALAADAGSASLATCVEKAVKISEESRRTGAETLDALAGVRSRVKRLESMVDSEGKRLEEATTELALQSGGLERLRGMVGDTSAAVQGLKRLVETNLRSHSSAEGIVKDQAQLITRHVCVALRQFISRRISENNVLIDKTLRARIPAYAEARDEFVLVRESEAGEDIGASGNSPNSKDVQNGRPRESVTVVPSNILDGTMAGETHPMAALMQ